MLEELREEFNERDYVLSAAVSAVKGRIDSGYDVPRIAESLDFISVMTYFLKGHWDGRVNHHAPLHSIDGEEDSLSAEAALRYWEQLGAPKEKLLMGAPFYGGSFTLKNPEDTDPGSESVGPGNAGTFTNEAGFLAYYEVCLAIEQGNYQKARDLSGNPYAYKGDQWIGYDDATSLTKKMEFVKSEGYGGALIWAIDLDDFVGICQDDKFPLLRSISRLLRREQCSIPLGVNTKGVFAFSSSSMGRGSRRGSNRNARREGEKYVPRT